MKSYEIVNAASKVQVLEANQIQIQNDKVALLEHIKSNLMITCKLKELNETKQQQVLNMLLEYWSPKKGINKAGKKFLAENVVSIHPNSSPENVEFFAKKEVQDHINEFVNAFVTNRGKTIVQRLQENIESRIGKSIKYQPLFEMVSDMITKKLKNDNM